MLQREIRLRISETEKHLLDALKSVSEKHPDLTTTEITTAILRIIKDLNEQELKQL